MTKPFPSYLVAGGWLIERCSGDVDAVWSVAFPEEAAGVTRASEGGRKTVVIVCCEEDGSVSIVIVVCAVIAGVMVDLAEGVI